MMNDIDSNQTMLVLTDQSMRTGEELRRPCVLFRPALFIDGDQWCALYGENLQEGVAGFGDTPELAMLDLDLQFKTWNARDAYNNRKSGSHCTC